MKRLLCAFVLLFALASCEKGNDVIKPAPKPKFTLSRTLTYPNRNNEVKFSSYSNLANMESLASLTNGKLRFFINVLAATDGGVGEGIALDLDAATISQALIREYGFNDNLAKILYARYNFTKRITAQNSWTSLAESVVPGVFGGNIRITGFDPIHRTISGTLSIKADNLMYDPMQESVTTPPDPANRCNLQLTATFSDIKIQ